MPGNRLSDGYHLLQFARRSITRHKIEAATALLIENPYSRFDIKTVLLKKVDQPTRGVEHSAHSLLRNHGKTPCSRFSTASMSVSVSWTP